MTMPAHRTPDAPTHAAWDVRAGLVTDARNDTALDTRSPRATAISDSCADAQLLLPAVTERQSRHGSHPETAPLPPASPPRMHPHHPANAGHSHQGERR